MPELPEVETIKRGLDKYVVGHKIESIEILHPKPFQGKVEDIVGSKILSVERSGKGIILNLSNKYSLAIHIKMTGQLIFRDKSTQKEATSTKVGKLPGKHTHVIFHLDKNAKLYFNDQRRFGWIKVIKTPDIKSLNFFKYMGPEPFGLGIGEKLTLEKFEKILSGKNTKIKQLIMDQEKIGGIGNIYANDSLWDAKINPSRSARSLSKDEIKTLFDSIHKVMELSIKEGGASELSYVNVLGQEGNYQRHSLVYGKKDKKCPRNDGGIIKRLVIGGRGTFYCPICQV